ncbi:hypothetical protein DFQ28_010208 [Apophysomyces sp. BC1034]|nr:hypothetical protein DFQ30_009882 [Apophysomyces sp. BC1015]KAG0171624.1 hypothetical protein DFQ29_008733 [Apophysomyces sp. BC1021]KAG0184943.1 hypothetical protein DFQ28_010208 [Apophysomyces sp. BC1034]
MTSSKLEVQSDSLATLLSFPVNFTVDPLVTVSSSASSTATLCPAPKQALSESSDSSSSTSSLSDSVLSKKLTQRKSRLSLENRDEKAKERILRNRAAAQESRDKKRRYVADLEATNEKLSKENERVTKRAKMLEVQNQLLESQLEIFSRQVADLKSKLKFSNPQIILDGFCDSARIAIRKPLIPAKDPMIHAH